MQRAGNTPSTNEIWRSVTKIYFHFTPFLQILATHMFLDKKRGKKARDLEHETVTALFACAYNAPSAVRLPVSAAAAAAKEQRSESVRRVLANIRGTAESENRAGTALFHAPCGSAGIGPDKQRPLAMRAPLPVCEQVTCRQTYSSPGFHLRGFLLGLSFSSPSSSKVPAIGVPSRSPRSDDRRALDIAGGGREAGRSTQTDTAGKLPCERGKNTPPQMAERASSEHAGGQTTFLKSSLCQNVPFSRPPPVRTPRRWERAPS